MSAAALRPTIAFQRNQQADIPTECAGGDRLQGTILRIENHRRRQRPNPADHVELQLRHPFGRHCRALAIHHLQQHAAMIDGQNPQNALAAGCGLQRRILPGVRRLGFICFNWPVAICRLAPSG